MWAKALFMGAPDGTTESTALPFCRTPRLAPKKTGANLGHILRRSEAHTRRRWSPSTTEAEPTHRKSARCVGTRDQKLLFNGVGYVYVSAVVLGSEADDDGALVGFIFSRDHASSFSLGVADHVGDGEAGGFERVAIE